MALAPMSLLAAGVAIATASGIGHGLMIQQILQPRAQISESAPVPVGVSRERAAIRVQDLKPIVVNLVAPAGAWARLEAAVSIRSSEADESALDVVAIAADFVNLLRTLSARDLEGASGLLMLREELEERAKLRADGRVKELFIQTLVVQ